MSIYLDLKDENIRRVFLARNSKEPKWYSSPSWRYTFVEIDKEQHKLRYYGTSPTWMYFKKNDIWYKISTECDIENASGVRRRAVISNDCGPNRSLLLGGKTVKLETVDRDKYESFLNFLRHKTHVMNDDISEIREFTPSRDKPLL